jgi:Helix-turn-helix domain
MKQKMPAKLLTLQAASTEFGVPYTSLRDWTLRGLLPAVRIGDVRRIWIRRSDLERLIERSVETGAPEDGARPAA